MSSMPTVSYMPSPAYLPPTLASVPQSASTMPQVYAPMPSGNYGIPLSQAMPLTYGPNLQLSRPPVTYGQSALVPTPSSIQGAPTNQPAANAPHHRTPAQDAILGLAITFSILGAAGGAGLIYSLVKAASAPPHITTQSGDKIYHRVGPDGKSVDGMFHPIQESGPHDTTCGLHGANMLAAYQLKQSGKSSQLNQVLRGTGDLKQFVNSYDAKHPEAHDGKSRYGLTVSSDELRDFFNEHVHALDKSALHSVAAAHLNVQNPNFPILKVAKPEAGLNFEDHATEHVALQNVKAMIVMQHLAGNNTGHWVFGAEQPDGTWRFYNPTRAKVEHFTPSATSKQPALEAVKHFATLEMKPGAKVTGVHIVAAGLTKAAHATEPTGDENDNLRQSGGSASQPAVREGISKINSGGVHKTPSPPFDRAPVFFGRA